MRRLAAERLLPGEGDDIEFWPVEFLREGRRGGVGDGQPLAVGGNPVAIRHAHAGGGAVPGEDHVIVEIDRGQIDDVAIAGFENPRILEL